MKYAELTQHTEHLSFQIEDTKVLIDLLHQEFARDHCPIKKGMIIEQAAHNFYAKTRIKVFKIYSIGHKKWRATGSKMTQRNTVSRSRRDWYQIEFDIDFARILVTIIPE